MILGSCSPGVPTNPPDTYRTGNDSPGSEDKDLVLTRADIIWPEHEGDECTPALPAPSITICMPSPGFEKICNPLAFYANPMDACLVGEEQVTPQPGGFYGGWITSRIVGSFKGVPGSQGW